MAGKKLAGAAASAFWHLRLLARVRFWEDRPASDAAAGKGVGPSDGPLRSESGRGRAALSVRLSPPPSTPACIYNRRTAGLCPYLLPRLSVHDRRLEHHGTRRSTRRACRHPFLPRQPPRHRRPRGPSGAVPDLPLRACPARIWKRFKGFGLSYRCVYGHE